MTIKDQQITGVINPTKDHEVANKLYVDDKNTLMKNYIDEKVKRAIISYSASSIKKNDKMQGVVVTNTIGNYSNGDLTFLKDVIARFIINVSRNNVTTGDITFNLTYVEQGTL